jgi:hypothetical protein
MTYLSNQYSWASHQVSVVRSGLTPKALIEFQPGVVSTPGRNDEAASTPKVLAIGRFATSFRGTKALLFD